MLGAISASPSAAAWIGLDEQRGPGVLEQEAAGAGLQRPVHVLVEVERRDHDYRERVFNVRAAS